MPNQWRKSPYVVRLNSRRLSTGPSKAKRQAYYGDSGEPSLLRPTVFLLSKTDTTITLGATNPNNHDTVELYQNGELISTGSVFEWELTGLTAETSYSFTARTSLDGVFSPMSSPLTVVTDEVGSEPVEPPIVEKNAFEPDFTGVADGTLLRTLDGWDAYNADGLTTDVRDGIQVVGENITRVGGSDWSTEPGTFIVATDIGNTNHTLRCTVDITSRVFFVVGSIDNKNATWVQLEPTLFRVRQTVNGTLGTSFNAPYQSGIVTPVTTADVVVTLFNGVIDLYVNGIRVFNTFPITLPVNLNGTLVGFGTRSASFNVIGSSVYIAPLSTALNSASTDVFWPTITNDRDVSISGAFKGDIPTAMQYQVCDADTGALVSDWQAAKSLGVTGSNYTVIVNLPLCSLDGTKAYSVKLRCNNDIDAQAQVNRVVVGRAVIGYGQSNSLYRNGLNPNGALDVSYTQTTNSYISGGQVSPVGWSESIAGTLQNKPLHVLSEKLSQELRVPVAVAVYGVSGVQLTTLLDPTNFDPFKSTVESLGGSENISAWLWTQGEGEASGSGNNIPAYSDNFQILLNKFNEISAAPTFVTMIGKHNSAEASANWGDMRRVLFGLQNIDDVDLSHSFVDIPMIDSYHYTAEGYYEANRRAALSIAQQLGATTYNGRGPIITSGTRSGSTITLNVDLNGATSLTGSNLNYWDVSADDFATTLDITSVNVVANQVVIELANAPNGAVKIRSFWSSNYGHGDQPAPVFAIGNYADGTTIALEPLFEPLTIN